MKMYYCPYCLSLIPEGERCPVCGQAAGDYAPSFYHLPPGTILAGRYLLGGVLDEDKCWISYLSRDLRLNKKMVVTELQPVFLAYRPAACLDVLLFNPKRDKPLYNEANLKFLSEALAAARIEDRPAVIGIRDIFPANQTSYYVTDYEGLPLKDYIKKRGGLIPPEELFPMAEPLFGALAAFHREGRYGAEFSPEKLRVENGRLRIPAFCWDPVDWLFKETLDEYVDRLIVPSYFALEKVSGRSGIGPWTDVYALCATLYYCLTGKEPPQVTERITEDPLLPPGKLGLRLTARQEEALLKGLCIQPRCRFQSIEELHAALYGAPGLEREGSV